MAVHFRYKNFCAKVITSSYKACYSKYILTRSKLNMELYNMQAVSVIILVHITQLTYWSETFSALEQTH